MVSIAARYIVVAAVVVLAAAPVRGDTPTETPTETPTHTETTTQTPTVTPTACPEKNCNGEVGLSDFAGCEVLAVRDGNTCTITEGGWSQPGMVIDLYEGTLDTGGYNFTVESLRYSTATGPVTLNLGTSQITISSGSYGGSTEETITVNPGTSKIILDNGGSAYPHDFPLWDVQFAATPVNFGFINAHEVTINAGVSLDFTIGHITANSLTCVGTEQNPVVLQNTGTPENSYLRLTQQSACEHATVSNIICDGAVPCLARDSTDGGGNIGWCFGDSNACPATTWTPTVTPTNTGTPTVTGTPTTTPTIQPRCCQLADGTAANPSHPGSTCVDNGVIGGGGANWQYFANCQALASALSTSVTINGYSGGECSVPGDRDSQCVPSGGATNTPTRTLTATVTPTRTSTPTITMTATFTPTQTATPVRTMSRMFSAQECPSPPCDSRDLFASTGPRYSDDRGGRKTVGVATTSGSATVGVMCRVGNSAAITLASLTGADCDTPANCLAEVTANCDDLWLRISACTDCVVGGWIDRDVRR